MSDTPATRADLEDLKASTRADLESVKTDVQSSMKHLEELVVELIDSLRREMHQGFDRIDLSVRRHSGMIVSGTFAISALTKTITGLEDQMRARDREMRELRDRIERLERKP